MVNHLGISLRRNFPPFNKITVDYIKRALPKILLYLRVRKKHYIFRILFLGKLLH